MIVIVNFIVMGGFLYLAWCGLKWIILRPYLHLDKKSKDDKEALERARKFGRRRPNTTDGGVVYPEKKEPEEVLLIEHKRDKR